MKLTGLKLLILISKVLVIFYIKNGVCYRQFLSRFEREAKENQVDYREEHFEGKRTSNWSFNDMPDPSIKNDKIDCKKGEWDNLAYEESLKFAIDKQSCEINIVGSKAEKCTAEIVCNDLNFTSPDSKMVCNKDSYLMIFDGYGGVKMACGKAKFGGPFRASRNGKVCGLFDECNGGENSLAIVAKIFF